VPGKCFFSSQTIRPDFPATVFASDRNLVPSRA
jgi:hypothetical protein